LLYTVVLPTFRTLTALSLVSLFLYGCGSNPDKVGAAAGPQPPANLTTTPAPVAQKPAELSPTIAAGTTISVELKSFLDSSTIVRGEFVWGRVPDDVKGPDGRTAMPAGSTVTMVCRDAGRKGGISSVTLGLWSVNILGQQYPLSDGHNDSAALTLTDDMVKGPGHAAVHLSYGYQLDFRLQTAVHLR
jgi:hypothetical protein